jgi:uncharacterized cupin superfamily protein
MPKLFTSDELDFGNGPFNKTPFGLLTILPNLCKQVDSKHLIFDIRKLPPGEYSFPYHYHRNAEEAMCIISGAMTIRTAQGFQGAGQGDVLFFETGESGAHQFFNHTDTPCTYFDVKTFYGMDVVVYPDSGKIMISQYNEVFEKEGHIDYFRGEERIAERWKELGFGK